MRKIRSVKHKYDRNFDGDIEKGTKEYSKYDDDDDGRHHRKKYKKHKRKDEGTDHDHCRSGGDDESPLRNSNDEVIEIHGSSSEDDSRVDHDQYVDSHRCGRHRHKSEDRRHKKRRKRSGSTSRGRSRDAGNDAEYTKCRHKKARGEDKSPSRSDSEDHSSNESRKREVSCNEGRESEQRRPESETKPKIKVEGQEKPRSKQGKTGNSDRKNNHEPSGSRHRGRKRGGSRDRGGHEWGAPHSKSKSEKAASGEVQKPNFGLSGKLAEDTNKFNGVVIKYSEPPEARMPKKRWRLYPFKGDQPLPPLYIHRQSAYLLGRDRKVVDMPIDHPSCSKQHAALQYRLVSYERADGSVGKQIRLYIIDLESANGTFINNKKIEARKYVELFEKDVIKFGFSSREYVLLHEHSKDDDKSPDDT